MGTNSEHVIGQDKNHIPPPRKPRGFTRQSYRSLTGKRQRHSERITRKRPLHCRKALPCPIRGRHRQVIK